VRVGLVEFGKTTQHTDKRVALHARHECRTCPRGCYEDATIETASVEFRLYSAFDKDCWPGLQILAIQIQSSAITATNNKRTQSVCRSAVTLRSSVIKVNQSIVNPRKRLTISVDANYGHFSNTHNNNNASVHNVVGEKLIRCSNYNILSINFHKKGISNVVELMIMHLNPHSFVNGKNNSMKRGK